MYDLQCTMDNYRMKILIIVFASLMALSLSGLDVTPFGFLEISESRDPDTVFDLENSGISEIFGPAARLSGSAESEVRGISEFGTGYEEIKLPEHVLVLMVEFPDAKFEDTITNQDYLANPGYRIHDFIDRHMFHLQSYYLDASKEQFEINYTVLDTLVMMDNGIEHYGEAGRSLLRRIRMIRETINKVDPLVDFTEYDSFIIFHSGAGKETDVYSENPNSIPSSFINRRLLQAVLDPENDDYPGLSTNDDVYIKEVIVAASHQNHINQEEETNYSVYGLLCYLFGRQLGLPTLFGNVSSLGRAAGAGNFCLMGTGAWNASGYVPPYLSAWPRYMMGWEEAEVISGDLVDARLDFPFMKPLVPEFESEQNPINPRLYKLPISDGEYYLIENREQNPDGAKLGEQPRFSFELLPEGEQDYYDPPFEIVPRFNFMKNTYRGCDWDFYLPGYGGPEVELYIKGSGILVWHIDENVIRSNFKDNMVNANPEHQGVTLIEAYGIQHLRSSMPNLYMRGSPYDSYRKGHNDYFGYQIRQDGSISIPYAESFYGNVDVEIFEISESGPTMKFSVNTAKTIDYDYQGDDAYPIGVSGHECSCEEMLFIPTRSGQVFMKVAELSVPGYPVETDSIPQLYVYSPEYGSYFVPEHNSRQIGEVEQIVSRLLRFSPDGKDVSLTHNGYEWATHPVIIRPDNDEERWGESVYLITALQNRDEAIVVFYDVNLRLIKRMVFPQTTIVTNMMTKNGKLYILTEAAGQNRLKTIDLTNQKLNKNIALDLDSRQVNNALLAPITRQKDAVNKRSENYQDNILITTNDGIYLFNRDGSLVTGFPLYLEDEITSVPVLSDITNNGFLDIIVSGMAGLKVINYAGEIIFTDIPDKTEDDNEEQDEVDNNRIPLGSVAIDINNNGYKEILSTAYPNTLSGIDSGFQQLSGYPLVTSKQIIHSPVVSLINEEASLLFGTVDGSIIRRSLPHVNIAEEDIGSLWNTEFVNLQRTAAYTFSLPENKLISDNLFVSDECYVFPSPLTYDNGGELFFNIMVTRDVAVEIKVFDISGKIVFQDVYDCAAYVGNRSRVSLGIEDLSSGVYYVILSAESSKVELRFAVEK